MRKLLTTVHKTITKTYLKGQKEQSETPKQAFQTHKHKYKNNFKIGPKMIKHGAQIDRWSPPRTPLESRSLWGALICTFLAPFGTPMRPKKLQKIVHLLDLILRLFPEPLFDDHGLRLGSQNGSKMRPKRETKRRPENHRFCN